MSEVRTTVTVEILDELGRPVGTYSRTLNRGRGGNPRFFGVYADESAKIAVADVRSAIDAVHGSEPTL